MHEKREDDKVNFGMNMDTLETLRFHFLFKKAKLIGNKQLKEVNI